MPNYFRDSNGFLNLAAQKLVPNQGFRAGQLGVMHAAMAHYSVDTDPAIICLPTGYGKTSVVIQNILYDYHIDQVIAEMAVNQLHQDLAAGHDHRLFVRTAMIEAARALDSMHQALGVC
ncbi:hypothetical protein [Pseudomonas alkylphenolica]|uniref:hypothetical protein n=1 Tax=Pseudomonas alkylphenolica TaxID=237609 RepID=UPI00056EF923|nr:hypothetical protein [Pseudomonas alkylphenolica]